jgi:hypothetical protein
VYLDLLVCFLDCVLEFGALVCSLSASVIQLRFYVFQVFGIAVGVSQVVDVAGEFVVARLENLQFCCVIESLCEQGLNFLVEFLYKIYKADGLH